jgi:type II secretory pathway predicted ATPase ExeA
MNTKKLLSLWGLKWNPFSPELPSDGLLVTPRIDHFAWRVEQLVQEGGCALITGESGTGKSVALRLVAQRLSTMRNVFVGVLERPQSKTDLSAGRYLRGEAHAVESVVASKRPRRWKTHLASSRIRPVLLIDEAQEMAGEVLAELRISPVPTSMPRRC